MTNFNGFKGRAKRLEDIDLPMLGQRLGTGEDHIHMFLDVESRGTGFDEYGRPVILFERHKFYNELKNNPAKLNKAVKAGLASKRAGGYGKYSGQYAKLERAIAIDETAALRSCSWGIGQVMGFNHKAAGYASVQDMVLDFMADEDNQLEGAVNFIIYNGLDDELRKIKPYEPETARAFASGYNGSGYRRNNYHVRLADALGKWSRIKDTPPPKMRKVVEDTAAIGRVSKEQAGSVLLGASGVVGAAKPVSDAIETATNFKEIAIQAGPWVLLALVVAVGGFVVWKRRTNRKLEAREALR